MKWSMINETGLLPNLAKLRCGDSLSVFLHSSLQVQLTTFSLSDSTSAITFFTDNFSGSVTAASLARILQSSSPLQNQVQQQHFALHLTNKGSLQQDAKEFVRSTILLQLDSNESFLQKDFHCNSKNFI